MTDAVSDERYYYEERIVDEDFVSCIGRRLGMASKGFSKLTSEVCALEFGSTSVFFEVGLSVSLVLPLSVFCTWVTVTLQFTFGWEIYAFISFLLAFLLIFRLETAYARYWEARTVLANAKTSIISVGLLAVTQYHRHYGEPGDDVKVCVEGVHRYLCLFYFTLVNQLRNVDVRQQNIEHYVTESEMALLRKRAGVEAPIKVVKWIGAQLCNMESMGYISPLQLHETNEGLEGMVEAFVNLEKIKHCKVPFTIRQFCTMLTLFFVYTSPFAIATTFAQSYTEFNTILGRTLLSSFLSGIFYLSINATSRTLEDPCGDDPHDLDLDTLGKEIVSVLMGMFTDPIPTVVSVGLESNNVKQVLDGRPMKATPDQSSRGGQISNADGMATKFQGGSTNGMRLTKIAAPGLTLGQSNSQIALRASSANSRLAI
jgi:predicted membrane chloride channel (bestrophin family)